MNMYTIYELSDTSDEYGTPSYIGWGEGEHPWTRRLPLRVAEWIDSLESPVVIKVMATMTTMKDSNRLAGWLIDRVVKITNGHHAWLLNNDPKGYAKRRVYRMKEGESQSWGSLLKASQETGRDRVFCRLLAASNGTDREGWTWWFE